MEFTFNKTECREGQENACLEAVLEAIRAESILKGEIENFKAEIEKREAKLEEIANVRKEILEIHGQLHNETQLGWSLDIDERTAPPAKRKRQPPKPLFTPGRRTKLFQKKEQENDVQSTTISP